MFAPTSFAERSSSSAISRDLKYVCSAAFSRRYRRMLACFAERPADSTATASD